MNCHYYFVIEIVPEKESKKKMVVVVVVVVFVVVDVIFGVVGIITLKKYPDYIQIALVLRHKI